MIELGPQIVKGGWCRIHAVMNQPGVCAKVLAARRRFEDGYPDPNDIVSKKYGIADFLDYEWANYQKIMAHCPAELRPYFVTMYGTDVTADGQKVLLMEIVRTEQGEIAPSLAKCAQKPGPEFFAILDRIRQDVFVRHAIDHFGIVRRNILIKASDHPVIIDFQTGRERYRGQFWLRFPWFVRRKVNRCFRKLYQEMGISLP